MSFNTLDIIIYYINLDDRTDRKLHIETELNTYLPLIDKQRIPAIVNINKGAIGCSQSHIKALNTFIESNKNYCMIFEDDFKFLFSAEKITEILTNVFKTDFNVAMLTYNSLQIVYDLPKINNNMAPIQMGLTAAGYIVNKVFANVLLKNFTSNLTLLMNTKDSTKYAVDVGWFVLQKPEHKFYGTCPCIGGQVGSYSDIEQKMTEYKQCNTCIIIVVSRDNLNISNSPFLIEHLNAKSYKNINNECLNISLKYNNVMYFFKTVEPVLNMPIIVHLYKMFIMKTIASKIIIMQISNLKGKIIITDFTEPINMSNGNYFYIKSIFDKN